MTGGSSPKLSRETFVGRIGERFAVSLEQLEGLELKLTDANQLGSQSDAREPFSLIFLGPLEPILPQAIYTLENPATGRLDLFLVPIGPDRGSTGIQYEAVFS